MLLIDVNIHNSFSFTTYHRPNRVDAAREYLATEIANDGYDDDQEDEAVRAETQP